MNLSDAQVAQAQNAAKKAMMDKEVYIRTTAVLARAILGLDSIGVVDGKVIVPRALFDAVPKAWTVNIEQAKAKANDALPDAVEEDVLVVSIVPKIEPSKLVVARAM